MKKIAKIASLIFVCVMLFATLAMSVYAEETAENTELNDIFQFVEYSLSENGEPTFGFTLNLAAKEAYENQIGKSVDIGIVIATLESLNGNSPIGADGKPIEVENNNIYVKSLNGLENTSYSFKLVNFAGDIAACKYVVAPYVYDGANTYYYQNGEISETVTGISFDEITTMLHKHTEQTVEAKAPTCTEAGLTEGKVCAECGEVLVEQTEIPALGHADEDENFLCDNGCGTKMLPAANEFVTLEQANKIASLFAHNTYTTDKYYITGVITKVVDTTYGNVYIEDENGNTIYIYGLYTYDGKTRYDAMTYKPVVTDEITVLGILGQYNDAAQMKNGWIDEIVKHECDYSVAATCASGVTCSICGAVQEGSQPVDHVYVNGVCSVCGDTQGMSATDNKYTFSSFPAGTQYAKNEEHVLDDNTIMITNDAHFTTELRLYSSSSNNAYAIIKSVNAISKIAVNAGNKVDVLVVYGSNDEGATWTTVAEISVSSTSYKDYTADLGGYYKWLKLDVKGSNQVRLKSMTLTTVVCTHLSTEESTTSATCTENGYTITSCTACGEIINKVQVEDAHHTYKSVVTNPTCLDNGYTTFTCEACGDSYEEAGEIALGHTYENGACIRCGLADTHVHSYEETVTDPTCTAQGYTTYTCACEDTYVGNYVDALGHIDEDGNYKCDRCATRMAPEADSTLTIAQAIALGKTFTKDSYSSDKYYISGTIQEITQTYYGNVYITDGTNKILVYGLYSADGKTAYNAMSPKPVVGEEITVYGVIGYYTEAQMKNAWVTEHAVHEHDFSEATCEAPKTCNICKITEGDKADHNMVDGVCSVCGHKEGEATPTETTLSFASTANRESQTSNSQVWKQGNVVFTNNKANSSNAVANYSNPVRLYQGSQVIIEATGQSITKIVFSTSESKYTTALKNSLANCGGTVTTNGNTITVEFSAPVDNLNISSLTAQVRLKSIVVYSI